MASNHPNGASNGFANGHRTLTALSRWSIANKSLPPVDDITTIHVYDFDNTLFRTPLPNAKLWHQHTLGQLNTPDIFVNGGWWHDSRILAATGEGVEREEPRGWDGWWNEKIVELVRISMQQKEALCVLLTGRSEHGFSDLIKRILASKGLEFDMIGLKPTVGPNNERFRSTLDFKQIFLETMMDTYSAANEIRIYEDRPKHVQSFRNFLADYTSRRSTPGMLAEVIQVPEIATTLDPVVEIAEIQHLINSHNAIVTQKDPRGFRLVLHKSVFFTSYMLSPEDTTRLKEASSSIMPPDGDWKWHANAILITARPCSEVILDKVGGMNAKMKWELDSFGSWENNIWAAAVRPIPSTAAYHTDNPTPMVVLATRRNARPADANRIHRWQPVTPQKSFIFETTVGEKVTLRIEPEGGPQRDNLFQNRGKRKFGSDNDDPRSRQHGGNYGNNNSRGNHTPSGGHHQGRGGNRGSYRGNSSSNRGYRGGTRGGARGGRGARGGYRSLDDVGTREDGGFGSNAPVSYDDNFPAIPQGPAGGASSSQPRPQHAPPPLPPFSSQQFMPIPPPPGPQSGYWQGPAPNHNSNNNNNNNNNNNGPNQPRSMGDFY
ncbi:hypothetical protein F4778DRAFT_779444 [Xylariomycetidae sp. FL2044]|nr:hypothetical protein F4778DRAFT_779444 [Xylariomycetidae sp. FL2044]